VFAELGAIGRSLNQIARAANRGAEPTLRARYSSRTRPIASGGRLGSGMHCASPRRQKRTWTNGSELRRMHLTVSFWMPVDRQGPDPRTDWPRVKRGIALALAQLIVSNAQVARSVSRSIKSAA
jgi:hypothetical protein